MKLHATKFGLAAAIIASIVTATKSVFFGILLQTQPFIPYHQPKVVRPPLYPLGLFIFSIIAAFIAAFVIAWFFAKVYNKLVGEKRAS